MIETSLDFSGLNDIAKDLEALSRAENNKVLSGDAEKPPPR